jgi:hypothetical protein
MFDMKGVLQAFLPVIGMIVGLLTSLVIAWVSLGTGVVFDWVFFPALVGLFAGVALSILAGFKE